MPLSTHKPLRTILRELKEENDQIRLDAPAAEEGDENFTLPTVDELDLQILMHRDAHFAGDFEVMLDYYNTAGIGIQEEFTIELIEGLQLVEREVQNNLASLVFSGPDAEHIARARNAYTKLKNIYEEIDDPSAPSYLIADLIFMESSEDTQECDLVIAAGSAMTPSLLSLIQSDNFYDPLFPGYGLAPQRAAECLGKIADPEAIVPLFEMIGRSDDFSMDQTAISALKHIGEPACDFLLKVLHSRPLSSDNERAALALCEFPPAPRIAEAALALLEELNPTMDQIPFATYLIMACAGLETEEQRAALLAMKDKLPSELHYDIQAVLKPVA